MPFQTRQDDILDVTINLLYLCNFIGTRSKIVRNHKVKARCQILWTILPILLLYLQGLCLDYICIAAAIYGKLSYRTEVHIQGSGLDSTNLILASRTDDRTIICSDSTLEDTTI